MKNTIASTVAILATAFALTSCGTADDENPMAQPSQDFSIAEETTSAEDAWEEGVLGEPIEVPEDTFEGGLVQVTVESIELTDSCLMNGEVDYPDEGKRFLTVTGELEPITGTRGPDLGFYDAEGYSAGGLNTHCDKPENTNMWMNGEALPGKKDRLVSIYEVPETFHELTVGNYSFTL